VQHTRACQSLHEEENTMRRISDRWTNGSEESRERRREGERSSRRGDRGESELGRERWESATSPRSPREPEQRSFGGPRPFERPGSTGERSGSTAEHPDSTGWGYGIRSGNRRYGVASSQGYGGAVEREGYGGFGSEGGFGRGSYGYTREAYGFGTGGRGTGSESSSGSGRGRGRDSDRDWDRSGSEWEGGERGRSHGGPGSSTSHVGSSQVGSPRKRSPKGYTRSDERIREDVCDRLTESYLECEEVTVTVKNGEVVLAGRAPSGETRRQIERVAEGVPGVQEVTNQIRTRRDESGQDESQSTKKQGKGRSSSSSSSTRKASQWTVDPTVRKEGS